MEFKLKVYFSNKYQKIGELTLDGFYNDVFMSVLDPSNTDELLALGLLTDKNDLFKFSPDTDHGGLIERGYTREEDPEFFKDYKNVDLPEILKFYQNLRDLAENQQDKLKQLDYSNLRQYYIDELDKLNRVFGLCLKNKYICHFTAYVS